MISGTLRLNKKEGLTMHNLSGLFGAAAGAAVAVFLWALFVSLRKKRSGDAPEFDER